MISSASAAVLEGGNDTFISRTDDADIFEIGGIGGAVRIQGFNGAGSAGGDTIQIIEPATVTRNQGTTIFDWGEGKAIVDAVGLRGRDRLLLHLTGPAAGRTRV